MHTAYKISKAENNISTAGYANRRRGKMGEANGTVLAMFAKREETQRGLIAFNYLKNNEERMVNRCSPFPMKTKKKQTEH